MTSLPAANEAVSLMKPEVSDLVISLSSWQGAHLSQKTAEVQHGWLTSAGTDSFLLGCKLCVEPWGLTTHLDTIPAVHGQTASDGKLMWY